MSHIRGYSGAAAFLFFADYLFLGLHWLLYRSIPVLVGTTAVAVMLLSVLIYLGERGRFQLSSGAILGMALAVRCLFIFQPPVLSDDIYRYLWDGSQLLHGNNPYSLPPALSIVFDGTSRVILKAINHPQYYSIYPPAAQLIFAAGMAVTGGTVGLKVMLVGIDMAACAAVVGLLKTLKLPNWRAVLYAWHPLPIVEIAWSGHVDGAAIFFLLAAIALILPKWGKTDRRETSPGFFGGAMPFRYLCGGAAIAFSILVKLVPVVYLPLLLSVAVAPAYPAIGCILTVALLSVPFLPDLAHMFLSLGIYIRNWEFSNGAFRTLRAVTGSGDWSRAVLAALLTTLIASITMAFRKRATGRDRDTLRYFMKSAYAIAMVFFLCNPTMHPWYALYVVAFFPFAGGPAGLVLSWAVLLSYHVFIRYSMQGQWVENDLIAAIVWLAPVVTWFSVLIARYCLGRHVDT